MPAGQDSSSPRHTRLRASCDGCFLAKVKCSKDRPICSRCLVCGADCKYSQPSRVGRPKRDDGRGSQCGRRRDISIGEESNTSTLAYPKQPMNIDGKNSASYWLDVDWSTTPGSADGRLNRDSTLSTIVPMIGDESSSEASNLGADAELFDTSLLSTNTSRTDMTSSFTDDILLSSPESLFDNPMQHSFAPWLEGQTNYTSSNFAPGLGSVYDLYMPNSMKSPTCNCFNICLQALQALHNNSVPTTPVPRFDVVLTVNRKAVEGCAMMLNCLRCVSKSSHSTATMLLGTIIGKIMSSYQHASKNYFGLTPDAGCQSQPLPLTFGSYRVPSSDRRWLDMEILLRELKQLEELFVKFQEMARTSECMQDAAMQSAVTKYLSQSLHLTFEVLNIQKNGYR